MRTLITKKLPLKKPSSFRKLSADSYKLKAVLSASQNLPPTTYHPASSAGKLQPSPRNLPPTTYHLQPSRGFTLVEMLVSISVFLVVMLVAASSLLSIIDGNAKAQSLKSAINNLNFALESMEKNIRVGTDYLGETNCSPVNACIGFTSYKDSGSDGNDFIVYRFNNESIEKCVKPTTTIISNCLDGDYTRLTAPEVHIEYANFYPSALSGTENQRVLIVVGGYAGEKVRIKTKFNLQTTVSQRPF